MPPDATRPEAAEPLDLYCLQCGYNLRGQTGERRRCSECGAVNELQALLIPAEQIRKQLALMESPLAYTTVCAIIVASTVLAIVVVVDSIGGAAFCLTIILLTILGGGAAVHHFKASCLGRPGWLGALLCYQLVACGLIALILTAMGLLILHAGPGLLGLIVVFAAANYAQRGMRRMLAPLQQSVAVSIIQRRRDAGRGGR